MAQDGDDQAVADVLGVASDRIRGIVAAAEDAVTGIRAEVRSAPGMQRDEGSRISRERLVAELAESLVARAEELSRDAADLADVLERASSRLGAVSPADAPEVARPAAPPKPARAPDHGSHLSERVSERFPYPAVRVGGPASRFKRRATSAQMAVAGSAHGGVASRLRDELGVADASEPLGDVPASRKVKESDDGG